MKVKSALKHSKVHAKFLGVVLLALLCLLAYFPNVLLALFAGFVALGLMMEVVNIVYIRRRSRRDAAFMEERIR